MCSLNFQNRNLMISILLKYVYVYIYLNAVSHGPFLSAPIGELLRQCCQVWGFSPRFEEFTLVMGNFSLDLGNFGSWIEISKETNLWKWGIFEGFSNFRTTHLATLSYGSLYFFMFSSSSVSLNHLVDTTVFAQPLIIQSQYWQLLCSSTILHLTLIDA